MSKDELGDRMKMLEEVEAGRRLMPLLPICIRLDGKGFSGFTRGLRRPYDERLSLMMVDTTRYLVEESNARIGYTQSDEISLILESESYASQVYFDGKIQKLVSVLAGLATAKFNAMIAACLPEKIGKLAVFDCRAWNVPNRTEAVNTLVWREVDATKNSVSVAARTVYSHKELHNKGRADQLDMLLAKGINWNDYPAFFKRGTYLQRKPYKTVLTADELERIPANRRPHPMEEIIRHEVRTIDMPPITKVVNRNGVVFGGEEPRTS